jgi:hypothetical protein
MVVPFTIPGTTRAAYRIQVSPEYGKCPELPIKRGILTGKHLVYPTEKQAKANMQRFTRMYFAEPTKKRVSWPGSVANE